MVGLDNFDRQILFLAVIPTYKISIEYIRICIFIVTLLLNIDVNVSFDKPTYNINEHNGSIQLVIILSNPSSTDITVQVASTNQSTATGEYVIERVLI